jgi:gamma-glutamyltranspeptidase / glutathione hydrolase
MLLVNMKIFKILLPISFLGLFLSRDSQIGNAAFVSPLQVKKAMVVSANPSASDAGLEMLKKGGNAIDAAVATTFAISVVEPFSAGIGGGGFLLFYDAKTGQIKALDFRERAPLKATRNMYLDAQGKVRSNLSVNGHLATATPGTVAGLYEVHKRYGKLTWSQTIEPAIRLAEQGFIINSVITSRSLQAQEARKKVILNNPAAAKIFTRNGDFYKPGERLLQKDLAKTLTEIAKNPQSFYTGNIARAITNDMGKNGGLISLEDLKSYKPIWRSPVCGNFRKVKVCSMPPPSSGGIHLLQILNLIGDTDLKSLGWHHPDSLHLMTEAMKIAYADRAEYLGDPDFVKVPQEGLINPKYAQLRRGEINLTVARPSADVKPGDKETLEKLNKVNKLEKVNSRLSSPPQLQAKILNSNLNQKSTSTATYESQETSHLNIIDEQRNAVSLTFTINTGFGAGVVAEGTGILLNNEMDDFSISPGVPNSFGLVGKEANAVAPRKTPLSSMTPTIVLEDSAIEGATTKSKVRMALGAPGGSTIITQVLQVILNALEYDMDAGSAISSPRIHHQLLPDELRMEPFGLDIITTQELRRRGQNLKQTVTWGNGNLIIVQPNDTLEGAADPRGEGAPRGF